MEKFINMRSKLLMENILNPFGFKDVSGKISDSVL